MFLCYRVEAHQQHLQKRRCNTWTDTSVEVVHVNEKQRTFCVRHVDMFLLVAFVWHAPYTQQPFIWWTLPAALSVKVTTWKSLVIAQWNETEIIVQRGLVITALWEYEYVTVIKFSFSMWNIGMFQCSNTNVPCYMSAKFGWNLSLIFCYIDTSDTLTKGLFDIMSCVLNLVKYSGIKLMLCVDDYYNDVHINSNFIFFMWCSRWQLQKAHLTESKVSVYHGTLSFIWLFMLLSLTLFPLKLGPGCLHRNIFNISCKIVM